MIRLRLTQAQEFGHDDLQRISLQIDQDEQELLLRSMQKSLATPASSTSAALACDGSVRRIKSLIGLGEGRQQQLELRDGESRERQELPSIAPEYCIGKHKAIVSYSR